MKVKVKVKTFTCCACGGICCNVVSDILKIEPKVSEEMERKVRELVREKFTCLFANVNQGFGEGEEELEIEI